MAEPNSTPDSTPVHFMKTEEGRKLQSKRMKQYWATKKAKKAKRKYTKRSANHASGIVKLAQALVHGVADVQLERDLTAPEKDALSRLAVIFG